jgi:hypothetical protein
VEPRFLFSLNQLFSWCCVGKRVGSFCLAPELLKVPVRSRIEVRCQGFCLLR